MKQALHFGEKLCTIKVLVWAYLKYLIVVVANECEGVVKKCCMSKISMMDWNCSKL